MGINESLTGRTVIILEDIVESGLTIRQMIDSLGTRNPASVHVCTLFFKPEKLKEDLKLDYVAFEIPNDFILGYGLGLRPAGPWAERFVYIGLGIKIQRNNDIT